MSGTIQNWHTKVPQSNRKDILLETLELACQVAANNGWDTCHIDLKTAFLQGDPFNAESDVVAQLPPEANQPPWMGARLVRSAYGLKDAPHLWWNRLDTTFRGLE